MDSLLAVDLSGRGEIVLAGADRLSYLHGLVTNDVKRLVPGSGCHAAFLTPKGKMLADLTALHAGEELLLDCEPPLVATLLELLAKYLFFSEVTVTDRTAGRGVVHVAGPLAPAALEALGAAALPPQLHDHLEAGLAGVPVRLVREDRGGEGGIDIRFPLDRRPLLLERLAAAGAVLAGRERLEAGRIEAGIPLWGRELDETVLPDEAGLRRNSISETKGCYIGQETVARIKTYGHVNRHLVGLLLPPPGEGPTAVEAGAALVAEGARAGHVTSVAVSSRLGRPVALAYVKRELAAPGTALAVESPDGPVPATVSPLPFA